ncbi:MAG: hypothetical protein MJE68_04060 [Proteobacteria bacterium]|nr:hypothetical protein [Pseudomonadota bacterium]
MNPTATCTGASPYLALQVDDKNFAEQASLAMNKTILHSVADPGFLEGDFCYTVVREARAKFWKPRPFLSEPAHFDRFERNYQPNRSAFDNLNLPCG